MRAGCITTIIAVASFWIPVSPTFARQGDLTFLPLSLDQSPPPSAPPFAYVPGFQGAWAYSDAVCTATAEEPVRTRTVENLGGTDRDQLASRVTIEGCFKGRVAAETITVLGDDLIAEKDIRQGYAYSGPPIGFLQRGRNLLFLRHTEDPTVWRVTIPVWATCIPLADDAPSYSLDGSPEAISHGLVVEFESAVEQSLHITFGKSQYMNHIREILGNEKGILELKSLIASASWTTRQEIGMYLLTRGYSEGVAEVIALLEDNVAESWKRANAARALRHEPSAQVKQALARVAAQPGPNDVIEAANESLDYLNRGHR